MAGFREKLYRATYFFFGGILILVCWSMVFADYKAILFNSENVESIPGDVMDLLFQYYLIPTLGICFCLIGFAGYLILGFRYYLERK